MARVSLKKFLPALALFYFLYQANKYLKQNATSTFISGAGCHCIIRNLLVKEG